MSSCGQCLGHCFFNKAGRYSDTKDVRSPLFPLGFQENSVYNVFPEGFQYIIPQSSVWGKLSTFNLYNKLSQRKIKPDVKIRQKDSEVLGSEESPNFQSFSRMWISKHKDQFQLVHLTVYVKVISDTARSQHSR